jgi:hypothetical protein
LFNIIFSICFFFSTLNCHIYRIVEVFSWLLEVANDTKEHWDGAKIVWSVSYVHDGPKAKDLSTEVVHPHEEHRKKLTLKLEIQKDDIQSVLPISKVRCLTNCTLESCLNSNPHFFLQLTIILYKFFSCYLFNRTGS